MKKFRTRFYYTITDIMDIRDVDCSPLQAPRETIQDFLTVITQTAISSVSSSTQLTTLWTKYLWFTYNDSYIIYYDIEHDPWEYVASPEISALEDELKSWAARVIRWINETSDRYVPLIENYETIKSKLMNTIDSENLVLYNDTPQSAGNWTTDPYTTTATKTTSKQEIATPIERLREVDEKLKSLYGEWANEFRMLVMVR